MNKTFIKLSQSNNTVFSFNDLAYYFGVDKSKLISEVVYYTKSDIYIKLEDDYMLLIKIMMY